MKNKTELNDPAIKKYEQQLKYKELSENTISQYIRAIKELLTFTKGNISKDTLIELKKDLEARYKVGTVNNRIVIINNYLSFIGKEDLHLKQIKQQQKNTLDNVLSETDYNRLIRVAENKGKHQEALIMQTLYYTGLRVTELEYLTVEALNKGYIEIKNKGKLRKVPVSNKLKKMLKEYITSEGIKSGNVFINRKDNPVDRITIFKRFKWIAGQAKVKKDKVYPHSFRHLFAKQWLKHNNNNILVLADILGHSSLETTRLYTKLNLNETRDTITF